MATLTDGRIGRAVRSRREELGLSRERLAALAGSSTSTIVRIELQGHTPNVVTMYGIAQALNTSLDALVGRDAA